MPQYDSKHVVSLFTLIAISLAVIIKKVYTNAIQAVEAREDIYAMMAFSLYL